MKWSRESLFALMLIALIISGLWVTLAFIYSQGTSPFGPGPYTPHGSDSTSRLTSSLYGGMSFDLTKTEGYLDGYNLFNLHAINASKHNERINNSLVIFDMDGNLILENSAFRKPVEMIDSTTILGNSLDGALLWNMETDEYRHTNIKGHHEFEYNPNSNTIFTLNMTHVEIEGESYRFDEICEYALDGSLVWKLDLHDFIDLSDWCPFHDREGGMNDVTHANSIFYDSDEDTIILSVRNVNKFYKINHATGEVIWALGEHGDFTLIDRFGRERTSLFYHAHSVEQIDDDRFILFDNDFHNQTKQFSFRSRILEIEIDDEAMTAKEVWSWTGDVSYFSGWWGDADRLANGNRLGTFGAEIKYEGPYGARLVEVNDEGEVVWEMSFRDTDDIIYGVYRMERIRFSPILSSEEDVLVSYGTDLDLSWQAWYNFRPKRTMHGTYELYVDDMLSENGAIEYDKFWRPTNMSFNIGSLDVGYHNVTLTVSDEAGHCTTDSVNVSVQTFHVSRTGSLFTETGASNSTIRWSGVTSYAVSYELSANATILEQGPWDESDILLDLNELAVGRYELILRFSNTSGTVYIDSFWATLNPSAKPDFITSPDDITIDWNSTTTMSWSVFDYSPTDWFLMLNGELNQSGTWNGSEHDIEWTVPRIDEGEYNVTMVLQDVASNVVSSTSWLHVIPPSPPVMTETPNSDMIEWAKGIKQYQWEVHGGENWRLYRNGTVLKEDAKQEPTITLRIKDWQADGWRLGNYNITLVVTDDSHTVASTIWLTVYVDFGDAYVDSVVTTASSWYSQGESAVGAPDYAFASIFEDYGPGYMTLDMGENEEILDEAGIDFEVMSQGGNYSISVSTSLDQPFIDLGVAAGPEGFDLSAIAYNAVRYVRIEMFGSETVQLDAIVSLNYNEQGSDDDMPVITPIGDIDIWSNQTPYEIEWDVSDLTPWNYSIYINGTLESQGPWNGDSIVYPFAQAPGIWEVQLVVYDLFGNHASSEVIVALMLTSFDFLENVLISSGIALVALAIIVLLAIFRTKHREE
ncbi:MAG: aryl-sulfate sulfotransferase [Promethearchaeota archaeon]